MSSTQVEDSTMHPQNSPPPLPPRPAVDFQAVHNTDQSSLPTSVATQFSGVSLSTTVEFYRYQQQVICSACRQLIVTKTEHRISGGTWCMCCLVFFVGGVLCCFIPFLKKSCKDVVHRCPQCNVVVGRKRAL